MKHFQRLCFFINVLAVGACNSVLIDDDPSNSIESNFRVFWEEFDRHYSYFELKDINWQLAYDTNIQQVRGFSNNSELSELLISLTLAYNDGHVNLYLPGETIEYDFRVGFRANNPNVDAYIKGVQRPNSTIWYGTISGTNLGYISIISFGANEETYEVIDTILAEFMDMDGIIIDVRNNGGGSDTNSNRIASRFADKKRIYARVRYRNGSSHTDFTEWIEGYIEPEGKKFNKPVAVLTNRSCYSSAEDFILSMKVLPQVSIIGGMTGGGSGNPIIRELPNGWFFRLSYWQMVDADFNYFEEVGIEPDLLVDITTEEEAQGADTILEEAIKYLESL